ncbi:hypothetical protein PLESTF_000856900 [Pleodorina starrii]|nr:hypothetical protein PLESTF_000856900 [Pleodorina starrii]
MMSISKSSLQELRTANAVLADELVKARSGSDQVRDQLREKESSIEALQATIDRLEKARRLVDKKHLLQLKELNRRYKEEQAQRLARESECAHLRAGKDVLVQQMDSIQEERAQLMDLLNAQRSNGSRLEATIAADAATIAELRSRVQSAESRLDDEVAARQELFGRHKALEADLKLATERHSALAVSSSDAEGRVRAAVSKSQLLEDELGAVKKALQAEKAAFAAERERAISLQSDLTALQTSTQMAAAAAAADTTELERLRGQSEQLASANEGLRGEVARLREEVLHLTAQGVATQAGSQNLQQQRDELQQQLSSTQESMERLERDLREQAAARARAAQEEAAARHRAHAEELAARLKAREKAWEEDRTATQRAHEEELSRKDMELLEVRERMREAQSSVAELAAEVATFKFQGERYAEVFRENEELKQRLAKADETITARDASLAEAAASHAAQLELWKAEANEVAQAASKWKQRCTALQAQLDARESETDTAEQELRTLATKLTASEAERMKLQEALAGVESKLNLASQESISYRAQLSDVLVSHQSASRHVETVQQDLQLRDLQLNKLNQSLNEEAARAAQLRHELAAAVSQHAKAGWECPELDAKRRALDDLTDQLHEAERARAIAQAQADSLREKVALLTREVGRARAVADAASARGGANAAANLRRSADAWAHSLRDGGAGKGGARQLPEPFDMEEEADLDRMRQQYASRPGGGRHEYDVVSLEEEAESWFRSLDDERRRPRERPGGSREAGGNRAGGGGANSRGRADAPQLELEPLVVDAAAVGGGGVGGIVRTYDVTISPKHGADMAAEVGSSPQQLAAGAALVPQPQPYRPPPATPYTAAAPASSGASAGISAGGAAAIAAAAYTAFITPVEQQSGGASSYSHSHSHVSATPQHAPVTHHHRGMPPLTAIASPRPSPSTSVSTYSHSQHHAQLQQQRQPYRAAYGLSSMAPPPQPQPASGYGYARGGAASSYGAMTPLSPVLSESASNASSNLQDRLQRLLGTGKLV